MCNGMETPQSKPMIGKGKIRSRKKKTKGDGNSKKAVRLTMDQD